MNFVNNQKNFLRKYHVFVSSLKIFSLYQMLHRKRKHEKFPILKYFPVGKRADIKILLKIIICNKGLK